MRFCNVTGNLIKANVQFLGFANIQSVVGGRDDVGEKLQDCELTGCVCGGVGGGVKEQRLMAGEGLAHVCACRHATRKS